MKKSPRAGQTLVMYLLIQGNRDVLFIARTGYGKSFVWQYMYQLTGFRVLMLTPLILLAQE